MDCKVFENGLDDFLEGRMSHLQRQAAEIHLAACAACQLLVDVARGNLEELAETGPADLTEAVLARTSGTACARAQPLLFDLVGARLEPADAQLVQLHTKHCARCQALVETMRLLQDTLPQMAVLEPDADLVSDVLQATSASGIRRRNRWSELRSWWRHLVARPQFTWEAAYVGMLVCVALFGTTRSPLREVTPRALAVVQINPVAVFRDFKPSLPKLDASAAWNASGKKLQGVAQKRGAELMAQRPGLPEALRALGSDATLLRNAITRRDLALGSLYLQKLGTDFQVFWQSLSAESESDTRTEPKPRE